MILTLLPVLAAPVRGGEPVKYELLRVLGSSGGVRPPERFGGRYGKLLFGKPAPPLRVPDSVAVDPEGRVWITDRGTKSVHMFDNGRNRFKVIGGAGQLDFQCPAGIDSDSMGFVFVADRCLGRIFVFDRDAKFARFLAGGQAGLVLKRPTALAVSRDRKMIFVLDEACGKLVVLNAEGERLRGWDVPSEPGRSGAVAVSGGKAYVLGGKRNEIHMYSSTGSFLGVLKWDQARNVGAFAYDHDRRVFYAGDGLFRTILAFAESGDVIGAFGQTGPGPAQMESIESIYVDAAGRIYVVDSRNAKVLVFREEGAGIRTPREPPERPTLQRRRQ